MIVYESTVILSPEMPVEKAEEFVEKIKKVVESSKGKVLLTQQLGKKKLAYPIKKFRDGNYVYMELSGPGAMIAGIENLYKVSDSVIRYLNIKVEKKPVAPKASEQPKPEAVQAEQSAPQVTAEVKSDDKL